MNLASAVPPFPWVLSDHKGKISLPGTLSHSRKSNQPSVSLENLHPFQQTKDTLFYFVFHINKILIQEIPTYMYGGNTDFLLDTATVNIVTKAAHCNWTKAKGLDTGMEKILSLHTGPGVVF